MRICRAIVLLIMLQLISVAYADDLARVETGVQDVHEMLDVFGNGAIVAILDRGIDYEHPDFQNPDGTSRILWITRDGGTLSINNR